MNTRTSVARLAATHASLKAAVLDVAFLKAAVLAVALGTLALPAGLDAQVRSRPGQSPGRPDREEMQRRIQARFGEIVRQQLGLDRERQGELLETLREFQDGRRQLARREMALRQRLHDNATLDPRQAPPLMGDGPAREILDEMRAIQEAEAGLFAREQERLSTILTPGQLVRFYALREGLAQRVRRLRQGPGGPGGPGGAGGPPGGAAPWSGGPGGWPGR